MIVLNNVFITYKKSPHKVGFVRICFYIYMDHCHLNRQFNLLHLLLLFCRITGYFFIIKKTIFSNHLYLPQGARMIWD